MNGQSALFGTDSRKPWQRSSLPLADPSLNILGAVHRESTDTERAAAALVAPRTGSIRERILRELLRAGDEGRTAWELASEFDDRHYSVPPRLPELRDAGWIVDSERRRITPSGALAIVWVLSSRGHEELSS